MSLLVHLSNTLSFYTGHKLFFARPNILFQTKNRIVQLNKWQTDSYFLQNFQTNTTVCLIIHQFCQSCDHRNCSTYQNKKWSKNVKFRYCKIESKHGFCVYFWQGVKSKGLPLLYNCEKTTYVKTKQIFWSKVLQNAWINIVLHWKFWRKYGSVCHLFSCTFLILYVKVSHWMKIMIIFERFTVFWKHLNFQLLCFFYSVVNVGSVNTEAQPGSTLTALCFEISYSLLRKIL